MTTTIQQKLTDTLTKLETALLSPPVAGELADWTAGVRKAAATLAVDLASYQHTVLNVDYEAIVSTDPELATQVEKMIQSDQQLLAQLTAFHEQLHALEEAASHVQKNEGKLAEQRQRVENSGIELILNIRKQQAAATTWLTEAHLRDRGVAAD